MFRILLRELYFKLLQSTSSRSILCMGDSHIRVFNHPFFKLAFPSFYFDILAVNGATAFGLFNPNSKTQAYKIFSERLDVLKIPHTIILCLGEVDTGYLLWHQAQKYSHPVEMTLQKSIKRYVEFISEIAVRHKTIIISAPLPAIQDSFEKGEVSAERSEIRIPQVKRTTIALQFNKTIEALLKKVENVSYINLDELSLDVNTGLVRGQLKNKRSEDHHYDKTQYAKLIIPALKRVLNGNFIL